jgi:predicted nucleic acid-binding protein
MGQKFLIDTNVAIHYLKAEIPEAGSNWLFSLLAVESNISIISKIELLGWRSSSEADDKVYSDFVVNSELYPLSDAIIDKTIDLRKQYKLKTPDAIIAATALVHNMTLVSRNDSDFQRIKHLKYVNPFRFQI